eukprot:NODE_5267_length_697_cov_369.979938_g4894_i0.p1 GENE.NODE_5267_length_697_cov_369.979938_g4894_i0~~NODE_5267_length_697_cov_369.979938_g4894_i0.p1  ORF type:complete len:194 (+),score=36.41 NODE_5267_length_697_cov_369.979938_g4894_i0:59-640(+)
MKVLHSSESCEIPEGVQLRIKNRTVIVKGPRGQLIRSFRHVLYDFILDNKGREFRCEVWFGKKNDVACIKTVVSHVKNMIQGVTLGFKYRMRFAYAHFPINVTVADGNVVEVRNFLGEKLVRKVQLRGGVTAERTDPAKQKDELVLMGNDIEKVSQSAADIHQSCLVKNKDIRKFLDGLYVSSKETIVEVEEQ